MALGSAVVQPTRIPTVSQLANNKNGDPFVDAVTDDRSDDAAGLKRSNDAQFSEAQRLKLEESTALNAVIIELKATKNIDPTQFAQCRN